MSKIYVEFPVRHGVLDETLVAALHGSVLQRSPVGVSPGSTGWLIQASSDDYTNSELEGPGSRST